jgi:hypothetical protein
VNHATAPKSKIEVPNHYHNLGIARGRSYYAVEAVPGQIVVRGQRERQQLANAAQARSG